MDIKLCKACHRSIIFLRTRKDRPIPVDVETWRAGDVFYDDTRHVSHFKTCTTPKTFSRGAQPAKAAPRGAIVELAAQMKAVLDHLPDTKAKQVLTTGLAITFRRDDTYYWLTLGRKGVYAGDDELAHCRHAFEVPADAVEEIDTVNDYKLIRIHWAAPQQIALPLYEEVMPL